MKKGRHRRFEEARKAKRGFIEPQTRCEECGGDSEEGHASWCLAYLDDEELYGDGDDEIDESEHVEAVEE